MLTELLQTITRTITFGYADTVPAAKRIFDLLILIEVVLLGLWWAFGDSLTAQRVLRKVLVIGFFSWLLTAFQWVIGRVQDGFIWVGETAGSGGGIRVDDPSAIFAYGADVGMLLAQYTTTLGWTPQDLFNGFMIGFAIIANFLAFALLAALVFVTYLEFTIFTALGIIFVPFGVFRGTSFLTEKFIGGVVSFGVKLMVMAFILSVTEPVLIDVVNQVRQNPSWGSGLMVLVTSITLLMLCWKAPAVAAGIMTGSPSLGFNSLLGPAVAAGGATVAVGSATAAVAGGAAGVPGAAAAAGSRISRSIDRVREMGAEFYEKYRSEKPLLSGMNTGGSSGAGGGAGGGGDTAGEGGTGGGGAGVAGSGASSGASPGASSKARGKMEPVQSSPLQRELAAGKAAQVRDAAAKVASRAAVVTLGTLATPEGTDGANANINLRD